VSAENALVTLFSYVTLTFDLLDPKSITDQGDHVYQICRPKLDCFDSLTRETTRLQLQTCGTAISALHSGGMDNQMRLNN